MDDVTDLCVVGSSNAFGQFPQTQCIFSHMRSPRGRFNQLRAFERFGGQIGNRCLELFRKFIAPTAKRVGPGFDCVFISADLVERADAAPPIVIDKTHWRFLPTWFADCAPFQNRGHDVMAIFENVRFNGEIIANNALGRITSAVDQRPQIFNDCTGKGPSHGPTLISLRD